MGLLIQDINALALMGHLDWRKAHAFDHFMGFMILCKFVAMVLPESGARSLKMVEYCVLIVLHSFCLIFFSYGPPYECQLASLLGGAGVNLGLEQWT
ncbi:hypothetical protein MKW98_018072 [Papaver atlanticum]|uniref:Uncharacterized protein n=1 Tax=Papaver atlanticum TaxID=357466 RepID=A0AAD4XWM2_9MAGN|nr:hypothetical protein MKW98_018072 [Papaver atlanticum]